MKEKILLASIQNVSDKVDILEQKLELIANHFPVNVHIDTLNLSDKTKALLKNENIIYTNHLKELDVLAFIKKNSKKINPTLLLKELTAYIS